MDVRTLEFRGKKIRIDPDGNVNITDVAQALGMTRQQWYMENMKNGDRYQNNLHLYRFDKRGPAATTIDQEGLFTYLEKMEATTPEAERLKRAMVSYFRDNTLPQEYLKLECENVLSDVQQFLNKLPSVPSDLAEEFVEIRKKIQAML